jgi:hypothetical protein
VAVIFDQNYQVSPIKRADTLSAGGTE